MDWYGPLTILPAIGLIIMSTGNFIVSLNAEIEHLKHDRNRLDEIIYLKLAQLKRLSIANVFLYSSALLFLFASLSQALVHLPMLFFLLMILAVIAVSLAIVLLLIHAVKAVSIKQRHLKL